MSFSEVGMQVFMLAMPDVCWCECGLKVVMMMFLLVTAAVYSQPRMYFI